MTYHNFCVFNVFDFRIDISLKDHAGDDAALFQCGAQNFAYTDIVDIESNGV